MTGTWIRPLLGALAALAASLASDAASPPIIWLGTTEVATGGGTRGPWRQNQSRYDYVDDPTVAIATTGIAVAWVDQARKDVYFQRLSAAGAVRGSPVNVSRTPETFSWLPRMVVAPRAPDTVHVLWQEIIFSGGSHGGDILYARSDDGGAGFSRPLNLSRSRAGDGKGRIHRNYWHNGSLDLAVDGNGRVYAAWTEYEGRLWLRRSNDGGRRFDPAVHVAGSDEQPARAPALALALASDGMVYLAWTVGQDDDADIRVARSVDGGTRFGAPVVVARSAGYSDAPKLAVDPGGVLHLVYGESADGPIAPYRVHYTRSADGGRSFSPPRDISAPLPEGVESAGFPALRLDADANLYALWELFPNYRAYPRGLGYTVSRDGGRRFAPPARVPDSRGPAGGSNGSHQGLLQEKLAVGPAGAVAAVNASLAPGTGSRVWLMRGTLGGN